MTVHLSSLSASAGFLKNAPIAFAKGLTCVIGARGTCKSTIVETIRFVFDCDPGRVLNLIAPSTTQPDSAGPSSRGLITATLQSGLAKCEVVRHAVTGDDVISIERELVGAPRLYRNGIQELADLSVLHGVEIYSQGDLQRIAEDEELRLALIDRPHKRAIDGLIAKRKELTSSLRILGPRIRSRASDCEARRADVRALEPLRSQLTQIQSQRPQLSDELDREREAASKRTLVLTATREWLESRRAIIESLSSYFAEGDLTPLPSEIAHLSPSVDATLRAEDERLRVLIRGIRSALADSPSNLEESIADLTAQIEAQNSKYYALRQEQQEVNESLKKEDAVKQQIAHLERLSAELEAFLADLTKLKAERQEKRRLLKANSDLVFAYRQKEVDEINKRHNATIVLTLDQGLRSRDYAARLISLLQGSRIRGQDDIARELADKVPPDDLIDMVEASDTQRLASLLNRDTGQITRLIAFLSDRPELYDLESVVFEDRLEITMYDHNVPKPINQLSKGQMATALLPLILRPAPYPLIFDQPEDDLDNSFIYETLVTQIRELKKDRQLIFVTHNANIPVLGDADSVVVMEMDSPRSAKKPFVGSVDEAKEQILNLLEGGAEAFSSRQKRYQPLLA